MWKFASAARKRVAMADNAAANQTITSDQRNKRVPIVTVESFFNAHAEKLAVRLEGPRIGFHRKIREPTINRPGLALSGFFAYFAEKRVQVLGAAENTYLKSLSSATRVKRFRALCGQKIPCLVVSRGAHLDEALMTVALTEQIAIFRTPMITMKFINAATIALEMDFSPTVTEFGSMVDILGVGVLIRGESGIGKSECVLQLIERGYSLVADDVTRVTSLEGRELMTTAPELTRYHMEVRGIGIINVASIFGIGAIRVEKRLDLVVTLKDWSEMEDFDRTGLDRQRYEILEIKVPHVTIPVRPGRDLARLIEVAAMDQKLKSLGSNAALDFSAKLHQSMERKHIDGIA
jgi:HPr kinase/phosphorylase